MKASVGESENRAGSGLMDSAPESTRRAAQPSRSPKQRRTKRRTGPPRPHLILFLAANPSGTTRLALDEECAAIEREIRLAPGRDDFDFRSRWAVSADEMLRCLNEWQPTIIHFSGHGSGGGLHVHDQPPPRTVRDVEIAEGSGVHRRPLYVSGPALAKMIASAAPSARIVVLNACFSEAVAESLCEAVNCVVSMNGAVGDDAARCFAVGFYGALGNRRSVGNAVAQGVALLAANQLPDEHRPVCRTRDGIDADQVYLLRPGVRRP